MPAHCPAAAATQVSQRCRHLHHQTAVVPAWRRGSYHPWRPPMHCMHLQTLRRCHTGRRRLLALVPVVIVKAQAVRLSAHTQVMALQRFTCSRCSARSDVVRLSMIGAAAAAASPAVAAAASSVSSFTAPACTSACHCDAKCAPISRMCSHKACTPACSSLESPSASSLPNLAETCPPCASGAAVQWTGAAAASTLPLTLR